MSLLSVDTPTDWISSSQAVTMKPNGKVRLCIDPKSLNKEIKWNDNPMRTIDMLSNSFREHNTSRSWVQKNEF